jgi:hypothetical protein
VKSGIHGHPILYTRALTKSCHSKPSKAVNNLIYEKRIPTYIRLGGIAKVKKSCIYFCTPLDLLRLGFVLSFLPTVSVVNLYKTTYYYYFFEKRKEKKQKKKHTHNATHRSCPSCCLWHPGHCYRKHHRQQSKPERHPCKRYCSSRCFRRPQPLWQHWNRLRYQLVGRRVLWRRSTSWKRVLWTRR